MKALMMTGAALSLTVAERVRAVYQEVWHEFFDWEHEYSRQTLASLAQTTTAANNAPEPCQGKGKVHQDELDTEFSVAGDAHVHADCAEVWYYSPDGNQSDSQTFSCPTYSCGTLPPAQPHESCTYTQKNLYIADDHCEKLPFVPFADDPRFPITEFLECFDSTRWEHPDKDPDYDMIAAEAVRRLHFGYGISFADIDDTNVLPAVIIEQPNQKGLFHILNQRDTLPWPGTILSDLPHLPKSDTPPPIALRKRVTGLRYLFCANLNCVEPYCPTHLNLDEKLHTTGIGEGGGGGGRVGDADEKAKRRSPCGDECYKLNSPQDIQELTSWDAKTLDDFKFILEGAADLSSCDLAVLCDQPCREVYLYRRVYTSHELENEEKNDDDDDDDDGFSSAGSVVADFEKLAFDDIVRGPKASDALPPSEICQHLGKCDAQAECRCYLLNLHCHRNCRCELSCRRRPKGCRCKSYPKNKRCGTYKCPCYRAGRECDPELCLKCVAKEVKLNGGCRNNGLQHGVSKALEVKDGAYGLGLFLLEKAQEGDLIGEYVGEILSDRMANARDVLTRHVGRNYLFALNREWTIDAALAGNEMRYINHAPGDLANCRAEVREVNGDHRIGIYAVKKVIRSGQELFMDYGKEYFTGGGVDGIETK